MMKFNEDDLITCLALAGTLLGILFATGVSLYEIALDNAEKAQIESGIVKDLRTEPVSSTRETRKGDVTFDSTRKTTRYAMDPEICA